MKRLTLKYNKRLQVILDDIYTEADSQGLQYKSIASLSGLHYSTVRRIGKYQTMNPHLNTIFRLAQVVGMGITLEKL